jgi:DNA repair ATPase RecN
VRGELEAMALELSAARRGASSHLRTAVEGCLAELAMAQSRFDVRIGWEAAARGGASAEDSATARSLVIGEAANSVGALAVPVVGVP